MENSGNFSYIQKLDMRKIKSNCYKESDGYALVSGL